MKKTIPYVLLIVMLIIAVFLKRGCSNLSIKHEHVNSREQTQKKTVDRSGGFDRRTAFIEYTAHALCRMDCRKITKSDIKDIMRDGKINYAKSDADAAPCPVYAVQGYTDDGQHLRVIFAQCDYKTKVVTCYDMEKEFECHCPGDDKK